MAVEMSKIRVMTANAGSHRQDLSCDHITTMNFMNLQPIYYRHMVPGEHIKVDVSAFTRLQPMAVPTFGRCRMNIRAFWVPFRTVFPQFTSFKSDTYYSDSSSSAIVTGSPMCQIKDFVTLFVSGSGLSTTGGASATHYDFKVGTTYYLLTALGRRYYKILHSLGYRWEWDDKNTEYVSMLALLSYGKVYCDWYTLSAYLNSVDFLGLQQLFAYNSPTTPKQLTWQEIFMVLAFVDTVSYDGDWLTAAWDTPVSPNLSNFTSISWADMTTANPPSTGSGSVVLDNNGTPVMSQTDATKSYVGSQYLHNALRKISDYMARHRLSGARDIDRYLVDWGINLDSAKLNRSIYLGNNSIDIEIGDVMSHADTSTGALGDYAGRGFGNGSKFFEYDTDEFGLFLIVASILPSGGYFQGMDRNNMHLSKYDFFTKDFDSLSCSLISKREVYTGKESFYTSAAPAASGFGYSNMYYEYKRPLSFVTGDMELDTVNAKNPYRH